MTSEKTYRIIHTLQAVTGTIVGIGMFLLIGTAGSLECDTISLGTAFIRLVVITLVGAPFAYALNYLTEIERSLREDDEIEQERIAERERRREEQWNAYFRS